MKFHNSDTFRQARQNFSRVDSEGSQARNLLSKLSMQQLLELQAQATAQRGLTVQGQML